MCRSALTLLHAMSNQILDTPGEEHLHHRTLKQSLQDSVRHFETSHPELTSVINNVLTSLANMGI